MGKYAADEVGTDHAEYLLYKRDGTALKGKRWSERGGYLRDVIEYDLFIKGMLQLNTDLSSADVSYMVTERGNEVIKELLGK